MSENTDSAYYQKNRDVVKKKKIKKESMEKIDITICLKRRR